MEKVSQPYSDPPPSYNHATNNMGQPSTNYTSAPPPIVVTQGVIVQQPVGPYPTNITCPYCRSTSLTRIEYAPSNKTHLMGLILCLLGGWCCFFAPYCIESCQNANHYCGNCNAYVGTYSS